MRVEVNTLQVGSVLKKDVMGKTNNPIIPENTVITEKEIEILRAFLIKDVEIQSKLINGEDVVGEVVNETKEKTQLKYQGFAEEYRLAVEQYKHEFISWQSGRKINISTIREILMPLFEITQGSRSWIRTIHQYTTKEDYYFYHAIATGIISAFLGKELGYNRGTCFQVALAGSLADCGMAKLPPKLLIHERGLTEQAWVEVKKHPIYSYQMLKDISLLKPEIKLAVLQHHERIDGTGYPLGEVGNKVHKFSQIIAIADIYHAMTSERPYKEKQSPFKVLQSMEEDQFGKLDVSVLKVLVITITDLPLGTSVLLSNEEVGEIIFVKPELPTRPMIKINETGKIIDLSKQRNIHIESVNY